MIVILADGSKLFHDAEWIEERPGVVLLMKGEQQSLNNGMYGAFTIRPVIVAAYSVAAIRGVTTQPITPLAADAPISEASV